MSQRKQTYTPEQLITKLRDMDSQVIHGSDFFSQCAEQLTASRALNQKSIRVISFFSSVIKSGEAWSATCDKEANEVFNLARSQEFGKEKV